MEKWNYLVYIDINYNSGIVLPKNATLKDDDIHTYIYLIINVVRYWINVDHIRIND